MREKSPIRTCAGCGKRGRRLGYLCASCEAKQVGRLELPGAIPGEALSRAEPVPGCCGRGEVCPSCWDGVETLPGLESVA